MEQSFHVDLRGVVDLLSRHLYSSPRIYLRELLQNAVDAITARGAGPREVRVPRQARVLASTGRFEEATKRADEARELFGALDAADAVTSVESLLADICDAAGS